MENTNKISNITWKVGINECDINKRVLIRGYLKEFVEDVKFVTKYKETLSGKFALLSIEYDYSGRIKQEYNILASIITSDGNYKVPISKIVDTFGNKIVLDTLPCDEEIQRFLASYKNKIK